MFDYMTEYFKSKVKILLETKPSMKFPRKCLFSISFLRAFIGFVKVTLKKLVAEERVRWPMGFCTFGFGDPHETM